MAEFLGDDAAPSERHLRKIGMHVSAYVAHVRTQLKQTIPKAIVHCLVRPSCHGSHRSFQPPRGPRVTQKLPTSSGLRPCILATARE